MQTFTAQFLSVRKRKVWRKVRWQILFEIRALIISGRNGEKLLKSAHIN